MFNLSDKVKINEELCAENKRTEKKFQFGSLNYLAIMLDWEFEVERVFVDEYHGDMIECKVVNVEGIRSNVVLKSADVILASKTMVKMDFEILGKVNKNFKQIEDLKGTETQLLTVREFAKQSGTAITARSLVENWTEIKSVRNKIKKLSDSTDSVFNIKHKSGTFQIDCKEEEIPNKLRSLIRNTRKLSRVLNVVKKDIGAGISLEKIGGVLTKAGKFIELNEKFAINIIKEHKVPKTTDNYVGIEIEMISPKKIEEMNKEFIKARLHRYVNIGTDGSIRSDMDNGYTMELRICLPESLLESKLQEICSILRKNDCYANRSCGMHVHLDMRQRDPELCYKNLFKVQQVMLMSQPISRRSNTYCKPNTESSVPLKKFNSGDSDDRYKVINTQSYHKKCDNKNENRTLEIRVHEGATKYKDVINWVKFLVATASLTTELPKALNTIKDLEEASFLDTKVISHLEERFEEYSA